jgi:hypothetical protein
MVCIRHLRWRFRIRPRRGKIDESRVRALRHGAVSSFQDYEGMDVEKRARRGVLRRNPAVCGEDLVQIDAVASSAPWHLSVNARPPSQWHTQ